MSVRAPSLAVLSAVCALLVFGLVARVSAHTDGLSWVATSSPYVMDVGYDPTEFQVGASARFDFQLQQEQGGDVAPYDHVWVRLVHGERTMFATGVRRQQLGPTTLLYTFSEPGTYQIEASYRDAGGNDLAVKSFPIPVTSSGSTGGGGLLLNIGLFIAGALLGAFAILIIRGRRG